MDGKVDWMAYGLPVEGEDGPFLSGALADVPTIDVGLTVADARTALDEAGGTALVVVHEGLAVGEVDGEALGDRPDDAPLLDLLHPVPSTVRPSVTVASVADAGGGRPLVTTSDGRLLGRAEVEARDDDDHEGHDHEGHDHGGDPDMERYESELSEVMEALQERFAGREPSAEEVQAFLRERLLAEGRSAEEADRFLEELESG